MEKALFAIITAILIVLQEESNALADQPHNIQKNDVMRVAVSQDFAPFGTVDTGLHPQGYDIDLAKYLAKNMKLKLQMIPVSSVSRVLYLQTDKVDLIISNMGKNTKREKVIDFTRPYALLRLGVFGSKRQKIKDAFALSGKTIGVTRGAVEDIVLSDVAPLDTHIKRYEDNNTTLSAYLSGQVQYIATSSPVIATVFRQNTQNAPVVQFMLKDSPCYIGLKKDKPVLKEKLNILIAQAIKDGTLNKLSEEWFAEPLTPKLAYEG